MCLNAFYVFTPHQATLFGHSSTHFLTHLVSWLSKYDEVLKRCNVFKCHPTLFLTARDASSISFTSDKLGRTIYNMQYPKLSHPRKRKCHLDEIFVTGCTGSCHLNNFKCSQKRNFRHNVGISVSMSSSETHKQVSEFFCLLSVLIPTRHNAASRCQANVCEVLFYISPLLVAYCHVGGPANALCTLGYDFTCSISMG